MAVGVVHVPVVLVTTPVMLKVPDSRGTEVEIGAPDGGGAGGGLGVGVGDGLGEGLGGGGGGLGDVLEPAIK